MSDKVNTSFDMMTNYLTEVSDLMSAREEFSFEDAYNELQNTMPDMPYFSIGVISKDGDIYGTAGEKLDIEKQDFLATNASESGVSITEPYRSSVTGSNMITMFSPIYNNNEYIGNIFVTYYLETVQNLAYTDVLPEQTAVFLCNPHSGNYVSCSESDESPAGTWSNLRLIKNELICHEGYSFDEWLEAMKTDTKLDDNILNYTKDNIDYALAYINIGYMQNWNIIIRIPITELSDTMQRFTTGVVVGAGLLVFATLFFLGSAYWKEHKQKKKLQTLSDIDPLTGIINRRGFEGRIESLFSESSQSKPKQGIYIFFDIDYFKSVNDNYGHDAGDQVLCAVASNLSDAFASTGIVARVGGDEFNILVYEPLSVGEIDNIMATLRARLKDIHLADNTELPVSYSAGLAMYPNDALELKQLIDCADKALYHVKENGRNNHFWYHDLKQ
jgi:diguanylate cyclase (GGDEF)-like protein